MDRPPQAKRYIRKMAPPSQHDWRHVALDAGTSGYRQGIS